MKLFVGTSTLKGSVSRYAFDLLEVTVSPAMPRTRVLRSWKEERPDLVISLRLHPDIVEHVEGFDALLARAERALAVLGEVPVVIASGPRFAPTQRNFERLKEIADRFATDERLVAWDSRGIFQNEELGEWAEKANVAVVSDLTREPLLTSGPVYTRLLPFGFGAKVTQSGFEKLAASIADAEEAYVVVQSQGILGLRKNLRELFEVGDE